MSGPRSMFVPYHRSHTRRNEMRRMAYERNVAALTRAWESRGWLPTHHTHEVLVDLMPGVPGTLTQARWHPSKGRVRLPGDVGVFKVHDPVQADVMLCYAHKRLLWQSAHSQLPHQTKKLWSESARGPHAPPWPCMFWSG